VPTRRIGSLFPKRLVPAPPFPLLVS